MQNTEHRASFTGFDDDRRHTHYISNKTAHGRLFGFIVAD